MELIKREIEYIQSQHDPVKATIFLPQIINFIFRLPHHICTVNTTTITTHVLICKYISIDYQYTPPYLKSKLTKRRLLT